MQLSQILNLVVEWGAEVDLDGVSFDVTEIEKDKIVITKG